MLVAEGVSLPNGFFRPATTVLGAVVLLIGAFDKWLWRLRIVHPWFVAAPNLQGTWKGEVLSTWADPTTGKPLPPIESYLAIRQSFSTIRVRLITRDSTSDLLVGNLTRLQEGGFSIVGTFLNVPRILVRNTSPIHRGSLVLNVRNNTRPVLEGDYWTDRLTCGELHFTARSFKLFENFEQATKATFKKMAL